MTHRRIATVLGPLVLLVALLPTPTAAQDHRVSVTGYIGSAAYSSLADSADPGVRLAPGGFNGGHAELWFGRFGVRLHAGFADTHVDGEPGTGFDIVAGDVDLVARFRHPRPGLFFQPYGVVGLGAVRYDLGPDTLLVGGYPYESDPTVRGSLVLGIGADFLDGPVAVRLELTDIIAATSPLSRTATSHFGAVSHVVLTLGLSVRAGRIALSPRPEETDRPRPIRTTRPASPEPPRDTTAPPPGGLVPEAPDTTRKPPRGQPIDTAGPPVDTVGPPVDTVEPPVDTAGPPVDTAGPPVDRPTPPPVDTTVTIDTTTSPPTDPTDTAPTDSTRTRPPDPTDGGGGTRGRLFTVRVSWDPGDGEQADAIDTLVATLQEAGVPMWPVETDTTEQPGQRRRQVGRQEAESHRSVAALRNAADARTLGNHIEAEYGLGWEWVHIDRDEDVPAAAVEASTAFVDGLSEGPGEDGRGGRGGGGREGGGGSG